MSGHSKDFSLSTIEKDQLNHDQVEELQKQGKYGVSGWLHQLLTVQCSSDLGRDFPVLESPTITPKANPAEAGPRLLVLHR